MGSGTSVLNQTLIIEEVKKKYETNPIETTNIVNECKKEILKLNRQAKHLIPPTDSELLQKFKEMDFNGNNLISLAEIDKLISEKYPLFDNKPALMRSYKAADSNNTGLISFKEFKNLWKYIIFFNQSWEKFEKIDMNNDRRISLTEFRTMSNTLFDAQLSEKESAYYFELIDINSKGMILFNEFCAFMIKRKIALQ